MTKVEKAIMVSLANPGGRTRKRPASSSLPALRQQLAVAKWSVREVVTVGTPAERCLIRHTVRRKDQRLRMILSRPGQKKRVFSNWHKSKAQALRCILDKISESTKESSKAACDLPARRPGVAIVHQIYGLYRDGKDMSQLFFLSHTSWKLYCERQNCRYILWTADAIDTLMQKYAPHQIHVLYLSVRFAVQRVDIARFFILYLYGGLYADLDILPNRQYYPQVTLGLCKMPSRAVGKKPQYEIELVVATRGNVSLLTILDHMVEATKAKNSIEVYLERPCRFIYNTTGPYCVEKFLKHSPLKQSLTFFSMCRPLESMQELMELSNRWRKGDEQTATEPDILSAYSMSYKAQTKEQCIVPLTASGAKLPFFPKTVERRLTRKGPGDVTPWRKLEEALSQLDEELAIALQGGPDIRTMVAGESQEGDEEAGHSLFSGVPYDRATTSQECRGMMPENLQSAKQRPVKDNWKRKKISKNAEDVTTAEAIGRLVKGY